MRQSGAELERSSTAGQVAELLRIQIARQELEPGDRLLEVDLARRLGVSRSPVREALAQLALEGLVESVPYRGTFVRRLDAPRLRELVDFRLVLEEFAVQRLAKTLDDRGLRQIGDATAALARRAKAKDFDGAIQADLELHDLLIELAGNQPLRHAYRSLLNEIKLYIRLTSRHYHSIAELACEHVELIEALREQRVDDAVLAIRRHIEHGFDGALAELERLR